MIRKLTIEISEYLYSMAESNFDKLKEFMVVQSGVYEYEVTPRQDCMTTWAFMAMMLLSYWLIMGRDLMLMYRNLWPQIILREKEV